METALQFNPPVQARKKVLDAIVYNSGQCICTLTPTIASGLEGYIQGVVYDYDFVTPPRFEGELQKPNYARVYLLKEGNELDYYEICGLNMFNHYFKCLS
jgi:hypothetical protein